MRAYVIAILRLAILASVTAMISTATIAAGQALTKWAYGGDVSLEWVVDASRVVLEAEIERLKQPHIVYRVTEILKEADASPVQIGTLLRDARHFSADQRPGDRVVLLLFEKELAIHAAINIVHPLGKDQCLALDRTRKRIFSYEQLLTRIRQRVEKGRRQSGDATAKVCSDGCFVTYRVKEPDNKDDGDQLRILVPGVVKVWPATIRFTKQDAWQYRPHIGGLQVIDRNFLTTS